MPIGADAGREGARGTAGPNGRARSRNVIAGSSRQESAQFWFGSRHEPVRGPVGIGVRQSGQMRPGRFLRHFATQQADQY